MITTREVERFLRENAPIIADIQQIVLQEHTNITTWAPLILPYAVSVSFCEQGVRAAQETEQISLDEEESYDAWASDALHALLALTRIRGLSLTKAG